MVVSTDSYSAGLENRLIFLYLEHILYDLLCLPVQVRMHDGHIVVAGDHIAQCGEALVDTVDANLKIYSMGLFYAMFPIIVY